MKNKILLCSLMLFAGILLANGDIKRGDYNVRITNSPSPRTNVTYIVGLEKVMECMSEKGDKQRCDCNNKILTIAQEVHKDLDNSLKERFNSLTDYEFRIIDDMQEQFDKFIALMSILITIIVLLPSIYSYISIRKSNKAEALRDNKFKKDSDDLKDAISETQKSIALLKEDWSRDSNNAIGLMHFQNAKSYATIAKILPNTELENKIRAYSDSIRTLTMAIDVDMKASATNAVILCIKFLHSIKTQLDKVIDCEGRKEYFIRTFIRSWKWPAPLCSINNFLNENHEGLPQKEISKAQDTITAFHKKYGADLEE